MKQIVAGQRQEKIQEFCITIIGTITHKGFAEGRFEKPFRVFTKGNQRFQINMTHGVVYYKKDSDTELQFNNNQQEECLALLKTL